MLCSFGTKYAMARSPSEVIWLPGGRRMAVSSSPTRSENCLSRRLLLLARCVQSGYAAGSVGSQIMLIPNGLREHRTGSSGLAINSSFTAGQTSLHWASPN